jgi:hypothetical protein
MMWPHLSMLRTMYPVAWLTVLTAAVMKIQFFWDMMWCQWVKSYQCFWEAFCHQLPIYRHYIPEKLDLHVNCCTWVSMISFNFHWQNDKGKYSRDRKKVNLHQTCAKQICYCLWVRHLIRSMEMEGFNTTSHYGMF